MSIQITGSSAGTLLIIEGIVHPVVSDSVVMVY